MQLYPLRFAPLFREYIWGGRRLGTYLKKPIAETGEFAESWELVDHDEDQSVVTNGPLTGVTMRKLIDQFASDLLGRGCLEKISRPDLPPQLQNRFPLLFKFLDANRVLSVQVHPNDEYGHGMSTPDLGKTEAWFVLHAEPDSKIYAGLNPDVDRDQLAAAIENGETESCLHVICPQRGDCIFIPAGTVHAIGAGLVIGEIQQSSDTTFRLFDWNRVDKNGAARPLHIEQALEVIDFDRGPVSPQKPQCVSKMPGVECEQLVACDKFVLNRWKFDEPVKIGGDAKFHLITPVKNSVLVKNDPTDSPLELANTMLLPACLPETTITPCQTDESTELLQIHLP